MPLVLVLNKREDEDTLYIGNDQEIEIKLLKTDRGSVHLLINAPQEIPVIRKKLMDALIREGRNFIRKKSPKYRTEDEWEREQGCPQAMRIDDWGIIDSHEDIRGV